MGDYGSISYLLQAHSRVRRVPILVHEISHGPKLAVTGYAVYMWVFDPKTTSVYPGPIVHNTKWKQEVFPLQPIWNIYWDLIKLLHLLLVYGSRKMTCTSLTHGQLTYISSLFIKQSYFWNLIMNNKTNPLNETGFLFLYYYW